MPSHLPQMSERCRSRAEIAEGLSKRLCSEAYPCSAASTTDASERLVINVSVPVILSVIQFHRLLRTGPPTRTNSSSPKYVLSPGSASGETELVQAVLVDNLRQHCSDGLGRDVETDDAADCLHSRDIIGAEECRTQTPDTTHTARRLPAANVD